MLIMITKPRLQYAVESLLDQVHRTADLPLLLPRRLTGYPSRGFAPKGHPFSSISAISSAYEKVLNESRGTNLIGLRPNDFPSIPG